MWGQFGQNAGTIHKSKLEHLPNIKVLHGDNLEQNGGTIHAWSISDFENYSKIGGTELKILKYNQTN